MTTRLFVYGSLKAGGRHHHLLAGCPALGEARTTPAYTLVDMGEWPALLEGGATAVRGELYLVDARALAALDALEEAPLEYERRAVALEGQPPAEAYVKPAARARGRPALPSGIWPVGPRAAID